jgi:tetratricopeptide (TPR) repeat protein
VAAVLVVACGHVPGGGGGDRSLAGPVREGKSLLESGQLDAALAELQKAPDDPDSLYYQGRVWAKKAESAPVPTPPPPPSPVPHGWQPPPTPELKPEEAQAIAFYERAIAARPDAAEAHLALAQLLAPHAAHEYDLEQEAAKHRKPSAPPTADASAATVDRVIRAYRFAMQADPGSTTPVEELIRFGRRVSRFDAAEAGFREMVRRKKERETAEPLVKYGDFLADDKKDPMAAIEKYREALIWVPDDDATRNKVADVYLRLGTDAFAKQQFAVAEERFKDAAKYITDRSSARGHALAEYQGRLRAMRH